VVVSCFLGGFALAAEATLAVGTESVPGEVSGPVKESLKSDSYTVQLGGTPAAKFWFRATLDAAKPPSTELGVNLGTVAPGSLVGVVQIEAPWKDYKENSIAPGVYTLRYLVMPADGNHMGASTYRDYLLLVPAAADTDPGKSFSFDDLVSASAGATGVPHPGVMAVFPIWDDVPSPRMMNNELGQLSLALKLGETVCGLVIEGHGEI